MNQNSKPETFKRSTMANMDECAHCKSRNTNHLENIVFECHDCGKMYEVEIECPSCNSQNIDVLEDEWIECKECDEMFLTTD